MKEIIDIAKRKIKFFKRGRIKCLEDLRKGKFSKNGFLDYKENLIVPTLSSYNFIRDKKSLRIDTYYGLIENSFFSFLMGRVIYDGNVKRWERKVKKCNIVEGELNAAEIKNVVFGEPDIASVRFSDCLFNSVKFIQCKFKNIDFSLSIFKNCIFDQCFFIECDFEGTLWGGKKELLLNGKAYKTRNLVNLCYSKKCSISTAEGIGEAPFFNDRMNGYYGKINKKWLGASVYKEMKFNPSLLEGEIDENRNNQSRVEKNIK